MDSSAGSSSQVAPTPEQCQAHFELGLTLALYTWPSLSLAVTNNWGGPDSEEKRQWFVGATIDVLKENPDEDSEWIETFLLQVMLDEFEVNVDDESGYDVAEQIVKLRGQCARGEFAEVLEMRRKWEAKGGKSADLGKMFEKRERREEDDETDGSEDDEEEDVDMEEAPPLVRVREPVVAEVDEDGFTKVTKKKR